MAENATIFQNVQIGVEVTPGTAVPANKLLTSISIRPSVSTTTKKYRPQGRKYASMIVQGKENTVAKYEGGLTYNEIIYVLSSLIRSSTPTNGGTLGRIWAFDSAAGGPDTTKTFTVEQGSSIRARSFNNAVFTSMVLDLNREAVAISGDMLGNKITEGVTMTATPTALDLVPVLPQHFDIKTAATQAGLTAASPLERVISVQLSITDRFAPVWPIGRAVGSGFAAVVETEPKVTMKVKMEADAAGMSHLDDLRAGDRVFFRLDAEGALIEAGENYSFVFDICAQVADVGDFSDEDGVYAIEWSFEAVVDATWQKAFLFTVENTLATL